jgi:hypothetical protein
MKILSNALPLPSMLLAMGLSRSLSKADVLRTGELTALIRVNDLRLSILFDSFFYHGSASSCIYGVA